MARPPLPNSHWIEPGRLLAGEHPSGRDDKATRKRLGKLLAAGIDCFIDLTEPRRARLLRAAACRACAAGRRRSTCAGRSATTACRSRKPPCGRSSRADRALAEGRCVYLHCRAGIGRTNLVAGCWIASRGAGGEAALERLNAAWRGNKRSRNWPRIPETNEQADYVRRWGQPRRRGARGASGARAARAACRGGRRRPARPRARHAARARRRRCARARGAGPPGRRLVGQDGDGALPRGQPGRERRARRRRPGRALPRLAAQRALVEHRKLRRHQRRDRARARDGAVDRQSLRGLARPGARRGRAARAHRAGGRLVQRVAARGDRRGGQLRARHAPGAADARCRALARGAARRRARGPRQGGAARRGLQPGAGGLASGHAALPGARDSPAAPGAAARRAGCCAASSRWSRRSNRRSRPSSRAPTSRSASPPRPRGPATRRSPRRSPASSRAPATAHRRMPADLRSGLARAAEIEALADRLLDAAPRARPG